MTELIVRPVNLDEPGSYRERKRFIGLLKRLRDLQAAGSADVFDVLEEADTLIRDRLSTDDGSPVEDALDRLSANQFDALLSAVAFTSGVGEVSAVSSNDGAGDTAAITPTGLTTGKSRTRRGGANPGS